MTETQTCFTTQGLVIRESNAGENDRAVTLLTKEYGLLRAYVPGAKSIKSKRSSASSLLTYSDFTINRKGEFYRITEATAISSFFSVGLELEILSLCQYFCELSSVLVQPFVPNPEFLRLVLNSLHFLTKEHKYPPLIKAITEFRIAVISGYMPNLLACKECAKFEDDVMHFSLEDGSLLCGDCVQQTYGYLKLDRTLLSALRHIAFSQFAKLYSFSIPETSADALSKITEAYLTCQVDVKFDTLDFYNKIKSIG